MSQDIFDRIRGAESIKAGFKELAAETGYSEKYIENLYYKYKKYVLCSIKREEMSLRETILLKVVSENPDNLTACFKKTAEEFNCDWKTMRSLYYTKIKKSIPVFNIISKKSGDYNVKNNLNNKYKRKNTTLYLLKNIWNKIKETLKNI